MASSSSPSLPSPSEFHKKGRTVLQSGSRAAVVPADALAGFKSVGGLLKAGGLDLGAFALPGAELREPEKEREKAKKKGSVRKETVKEKDESDAEASIPEPAPKRKATVGKGAKSKPKELKKSSYFGEPEVSVHDKGRAEPGKVDKTQAQDIPKDVKSTEDSLPNAQAPAKTPAGKSTAGRKRKSDEISRDLDNGSVAGNQRGCAVEVVIEAAPTAPVPAKATTKRTAKKRKSDDAVDAPKQTRIKKPKVVKPRARSDTAKRIKESVKVVQANATKLDKPKKTSKTSSHFDNKEPTAIVEPQTAEVADVDPSMEVLEGRRDWTPVKDTERPVDVKSIDTSTPATATIVATQPIDQETFKNLAGNFGCADIPKVPVPTSASEKPLKRGRQLKSVTVNAAPLPKVKKAKSPRKKATTITDKATEQYRAAPLITSEQLLGGASSIQTMLELKKPTDDVDVDVNKAKPGRRKRTTSPAKGGTRAKKEASSKPVYLVPKLLSPESALQKLQQQDILFGTSSQLAQPESPTFIRALQASFNDSGGSSMTTAARPRYSSKLAAITGSRTLWAAAARDGDEALLYRSPRRTVPVQTRRQSTDESYVDIDDVSLPLENFHPREDEAQAPEPPEVEADVAVEPKSLGLEATPRALVIENSSPPAPGLPSPEPEAEPEPHILADDAARPFVVEIRSSSPALPTFSSPVLPPYSSPVSDELPELSRLISTAQSRILPIRSSSPSGLVLQHAAVSAQLVRGSGVSATFIPPGMEPPMLHSGVQWRYAISKAKGARGAATSPVKRSPGRPRKDATKISQSKTSPAKSPKARKTASPRATPSKLSQWKDIDEIEDSEPDFCSPSPSPPRSQKAALSLTSPSFKSRSQPKANSPVRDSPPRKSRSRSASPSPKAAAPKRARTRSKSPTRSKTKTKSTSSKVPASSQAKTTKAKRKPAKAKNSEATTSTSTTTISAQEWALTKPNLFAQIKHTLTSEPPTTDPQNLTWHEKILMYDPIEPAKLMAWLVEKGIHVAVEMDGEEARECMLQPWMVYEWCEEMSICCIWDEGLRRGVKGARGKS